MPTLTAWATPPPYRQNEGIQAAAEALADVPGEGRSCCWICACWGGIHLTTAAFGKPITRFSGWSGKKAWAAGLLLSTVTTVLLFAFADVHYPNNDDVFIMRAFMGFQPSGPVTFVKYLQPLISWPMHALGVMSPGIAWFSVMQVFLLWLANAVIGKSIIQCSMRACRPVWLGIVAAVGFLLLFSLQTGAQITYSVTSAVLGAAAVAQLVSMDMAGGGRRRFAAGVAGTACLYALATGLREENAAVTLAVLCIALGYHALCLWDGRELRVWRCAPLRKVAMALAVFLVTTAVLFGWEALDTRLQGETADVQWQRARMSVMDYLNMERIPDTLTTSVGWSTAQVTQLQVWNTMDAAFSTEAFTRIAQNAPTTAKPTLRELLAPLYKKSLWAVLAIAAVALLGVYCLYGAWFGKTHRRYRLWIPVLLAGLLCAAMIGYLALRRRMPERALLSAVLPITVLLLCLLPQCIPAHGQWPRGWGHRIARGLLCALLCGSMLASVSLTVTQVWRKPVKWTYDTYLDMDTQALNHPELLLVYERNLVGDVRMFPPVTQGIPTNLTFWGGWIRAGKEYRSRLAAFGLDADHFTAKDWLNPSIRLVSLKADPSDAFMNYLRDQLGPEVTCQSEQVSAGLYFLRFVPASTATPGA